MATYRFAQAGDKPGILALFTPAMVQELRDDNDGTFAVPDPDAHTGPNFRHIVGLDNSNVIRGYTRLENVGGRWQIELTVVDKSLSLNQRLTHFKLMTKQMCQQVPAGVVIFGRVKIGGNLDNFLSGQPFTRTIVGEKAEFEATAGVIAGVF